MHCLAASRGITLGFGLIVYISRCRVLGLLGFLGFNHAPNTWVVQHLHVHYVSVAHTSKIIDTLPLLHTASQMSVHHTCLATSPESPMAD